MRITGVNFKENTNNTNKVNLNQINPINAFALHLKNIQLNSLDKDIFVKQTPSTDNIAFTGEVKFTTNEFKKKFNKTFFKKLMREDIPDAYTGKSMIAQEEIDTLKSLGVFKKKSSIAMKYLKEYEDCMYPIEKEIYYILKNLAKKHPDMNLQELLQMKHKRAEEILIQQQTKILDKINMMIRVLPRGEYLQARKFINGAFDKILDPNPTPETRFSRKVFLHGLDDLKISDPKTKEKIMAVASKLPQSSNSINAFIVKYSHTTKIIDKNPFGKQEIVVIPRSPEEIALRLLDPSVQSDEHIWPQAEFRKLEEQIQKGEIKREDANTLRVSILTSKHINNLKSDTLIDDFITEVPEYDIPKNIQTHMDKLIEVMDKWARAGKYEDAALLGEYIKVLENEFILRSNTIRVNVGDLDPRIAELQQKAEEALQKRIEKKQRRAANASNNHGEVNYDKHGNTLENRKILMHIPKFNP
ncbi:hypothetical protein IJ472_01155 [bacterium]|nr:hypothetical protein [bacterium]